jgi:hypothetical protein
MSIAAPAPTSDAPAPVAPEEWIQRMTAAYRAGPMVEHVTFASAGGATARTDAWVRVDAGSPDDAPPRVARLRLDAGRAIIWAQGDRVVFTHADNPTTYAERVVAGGFSSGLLRELPQSPLPQIGLALADDLPHWDPRRVRWSHAAVTNDAATLEGTLEQQRVRLVLDAATARIKSFEFKLAQGQTLAATVTRHPPEDPQTWPVSITGRAKVASPADLRALPRPIEPGQAAPTLGLMTKDLSGWSLVENLSEAKPRGASAAIGALVLVGAASDPAQVDLALRAHRASMRLARELDAQLAQGLPATPKLIARMVGVLELRDVSRERIALLDAQWRAAATARGGPAPDLLWTGGGIETLRQLAPAQTIALALIDDRQALLGVVTLEGRLLDESAIADEVRAMLREPPAGAGPSPDKKAENSPAETPAEAGPPRDK